MSRWSAFTIFVCASLLSSSLFGQWAPQSQYPQTQYPQSQYPDNQQPQSQPQPAPDQPMQNQQSGSADQAIPDTQDLQHGVARISVAQGDVNVRRGDNNQLTGAIINAPLVARDHVETSSGSRAEVQLDAVTLMRLAPNTDVGFADLQYHRAQIQLGLGTIIFRVLQTSPTQVEIDTSSVGVRALAPGEYRISVFDNGTSQISVTSGQAEILAPTGSERLNAGRSVMVRGDAATPELQDTVAVPRDQFDEWSAGRDQELSASQSARYMNTDMQGAADLDHYGNWVSSGYGQVWQPQGVSPDWSPYSNGQWSYVDYYGWSWVDYSPWGWAPYHYGRWFNNPGYGWCWWPGSHLRAAYYSPALVGFFGFGGGIGVGFGSLGWVALAPFELFHPWWGRGGFGFGVGFGGGFGVSAYRNAAFRGGVRFASVNGFAGQHQHFGVATHSQLIAANGINGRLPVSNIRAGMNYTSRAAVPNNHFASVPSRSFYNGAQNNRSFAASSANAIRGSAPRSYTSAPGNSGSAGWQRFGSPASSSAPHSNFQGSDGSPWHSFGSPLSGASRGYSAAPRSPSVPAYQQPRSNYSAPRAYNQPNRANAAPRQNSSPRQSQPKSAPAPRSSGGGGHSSGGGGHHR